MSRKRKQKHYPVLWLRRKPEGATTPITHQFAGNSERSTTAQNIPRKNNAANNLFALLGGRENVLDLLEGSTEEKMVELRQLLESDAGDQRSDGAVKMTFGKMLAVTGVSEENVYKLFLSRKRAETVVTLAEAEPKLAGELIERASKRKVLCRSCGGTKWIYSEDEDGSSHPCTACDKNGQETLFGDQDSIELFFDLSKLKTNAPFVEVNNDNRSVSFQVGMPGTAPNPLATIRSLEMVKDSGPKALPPVSVNPLEQLPVKEAELVNK